MFVYLSLALLFDTNHVYMCVCAAHWLKHTPVVRGWLGINLHYKVRRAITRLVGFRYLQVLVIRLSV